MDPLAAQSPPASNCSSVRTAAHSGDFRKLASSAAKALMWPRAAFGAMSDPKSTVAFKRLDNIDRVLCRAYISSAEITPERPDALQVQGAALDPLVTWTL